MPRKAYIPRYSVGCIDCDRQWCTTDDYMVFDEVWKEAGLDPSDRSLPHFILLCVPCLESRLGRPLEIRDLPNVPINEPFVIAYLKRMPPTSRHAKPVFDPDNPRIKPYT